MNREQKIIVGIVAVCAASILAMGCADDAKDESHADSGDDSGAHPDEPVDLYVDLDGDGKTELLPADVEDRRVKYEFGLDERQGPEGDEPEQPSRGRGRF